jgi:cation diffusion facilitator CzcD-associated flavoprotein CzcO
VDETGTVIVGAGPAGLAMGACLRRREEPFVVLEQGAAVGDSWRTRYRRLHLHTAKQHSGLPHLAFPRQHPRYPSRDQVVEYLQLYSRHFAIEPRLGQGVLSIKPEAGGGWTTTTTGGAWRSRRVVICTGHSGMPRRPHWPGQETFAGEVLHSSAYDSGERFAGKRVLVVGLGNSGGEIAIDLVEHGAAVGIAVRSPVNVVPRDFLGMPIQRSTILLSVLPLPVRDAVGRLVSRLVFGDLRRLGLPRPAEGPVSQIQKRGRIPLIDVGTIALIREGKIALLPDVQAFERQGVRFADGQSRPFEAVVLATGYRPAVAPLLPEQPAVLDEHGYPRALDAPALPGLYFVGFSTPPTGLLRQIGIDARRVAAMIRP